ncbi:uncharacterized protein CANTADRAFT_87440 [Suhomyces tanzawaensis NRRL Y-17324]|uniref:Uncharacterized protein n=1 Tax=Suhomyces tanzawaensis NRRL Y-17324 TaxID=984487 RepID=A0A1E4SPK0_9ASCO|nr:uncharacterized protein CANTADRAFT_87440 [Suhomyces tanzawaensis NRRL Y-17324]ODV81449.1 hypothetical protein CANTADRAFT_87440 [Suhomyces tanzawaensis NRRL Y-17324]
MTWSQAPLCASTAKCLINRNMVPLGRNFLTRSNRIIGMILLGIVARNQHVSALLSDFYSRMRISRMVQTFDWEFSTSLEVGNLVD